MKILDLSAATLEEIADPSAFPSLGVATDSSMVINPKPLFLPETAEEWQLEVCPAIVINRLGKRIARRFASRYYSEFTLMVHAVPVASAIASTAWAEAVDCAWLSGNRVGIEAVASHPEIEMTAPQSQRLECEDIVARVNAAIESLSRFFTLKNGDIIVLPPLTTLAATLDSRLTLTHNARELINARIK